MIESKTGRHPEQLRTLSAHLQKIEDDITDPRTEHIHRKPFLDNADPEESQD